MPSSYRTILADRSYCPRCGQHPSLLFDNTGAENPSFYVCACGFIGEVGQGTVVPLTEDHVTGVDNTGPAILGLIPPRQPDTARRRGAINDDRWVVETYEAAVRAVAKNFAVPEGKVRVGLSDLATDGFVVVRDPLAIPPSPPPPDPSTDTGRK